MAWFGAARPARPTPSPEVVSSDREVRVDLDESGCWTSVTDRSRVDAGSTAPGQEETFAVVRLQEEQ